MKTIPLEEVQSHLAEIIENLPPGQEILIVRDKMPVARILGMPPMDEPRPIPGRGKGMLTVVSEDDEHLKDWAEYL